MLSRSRFLDNSVFILNRNGRRWNLAFTHSLGYEDTVLQEKCVAILLKLLGLPVLICFDLEWNNGEDGSRGSVCAR
jgi:hypothetical protein